MSQMRVALMDGPERPLSLAERPVPAPGPGEILSRSSPAACASPR